MRVLSRLFRRLFLKYLEAAFDAGDLQFFSSLEPLRIKHTFLRHLALLRKAKWVVYAKAPFDGPQAVLSSTLADLGSVGEGIFHALPDMARNFDTVSARP